MFSYLNKILTLALIAIFICLGCQHRYKEKNILKKPTDIETIAYSAVGNDGTYRIISPSGDYYSVWVASYLDQKPALKRVKELQTFGLEAFSVTKELQEINSGLSNDDIGTFYLSMVGLFLNKDKAKNLGERLLAQNRIKAYQITPIEKPSDLEIIKTQNFDASSQALKKTIDIEKKISKPLSPTSGVLTGKSFQNLVKGRYIGSFSTIEEARKEAEALNAAGWQASISPVNTEDSGWYRVYLSKPEDQIEYLANPTLLSQDKASASSQEGVFILADSGTLSGVFGLISPENNRSDASACAGYSEAGLMLSVLAKTVSVIPDSIYIAALKPVANNLSGSYTRNKVREYLNNKQPLNEIQNLFGPEIFNRPKLASAVSALTTHKQPDSLAYALINLEYDLQTVPGKKNVLIFSNFNFLDNRQDLLKVLASLKALHGDLINIQFIYGDSSLKGYQLVKELGEIAGIDNYWDACLLSVDNKYFERFKKRSFYN